MTDSRWVDALLMHVESAAARANALRIKAESADVQCVEDATALLARAMQIEEDAETLRAIMPFISRRA